MNKEVSFDLILRFISADQKTFHLFHFQGFEIRQCITRCRGSCEDSWLWNVQRRHTRGENYKDFLWHTRLYCTRGELPLLYIQTGFLKSVYLVKLWSLFEKKSMKLVKFQFCDNRLQKVVQNLFVVKYRKWGFVLKWGFSSVVSCYSDQIFFVQF